MHNGTLKILYYLDPSHIKGSLTYRRESQGILAELKLPNTAGKFTTNPLQQRDSKYVLSGFCVVSNWRCGICSSSWPCLSATCEPVSLFSDYFQRREVCNQRKVCLRCHHAIEKMFSDVSHLFREPHLYHHDSSSSVSASLASSQAMLGLVSVLFFTVLVGARGYTRRMFYVDLLRLLMLRFT